MEGARVFKDLDKLAASLVISELGNKLDMVIEAYLDAGVNMMAVSEEGIEGEALVVLRDNLYKVYLWSMGIDSEEELVGAMATYTAEMAEDFLREVAS